MLSFDIEQEHLEELIEKRRKELEVEVIENKEDEDKETIYPLFRNYPNGTPDYYLKLKSIKFASWKNDLRILFIDKTIMGDKYYNLLKKLGCKILKQKKYDRNLISNYNLIISNCSSVDEFGETPIIYVNCKPISCPSKRSLFYFDDKKLHKKYSYYFYSHKIQNLYREKTSDFIDAISKIKEVK